MEDEPKRFELLDWGLDRQPEQESLGGPPRPERIGLLAARPGVQQGTLLAEARDEGRPGQLGHRADPAQSEAGQPGADVGVGREETGRVGREERSVVTDRDEERLVGLRMDCRDRGREPGPGNPRPRLPGEQSLQRAADLFHEHRLGAPQRPESVDLDLEEAKRRIVWIARPGDPRAERSQPLEGGLDDGRVGVGVRVEEDRLRRQPMRGAERHPAVYAECPRFGAGVDDHPRRPRLAAEDRGAGRERAEARARMSASGRCGQWR